MGEDESRGANLRAPSVTAAAAQAAQPGGFRLLRYFTITTLLAFLAVAGVLFVLQRGEEAFFSQVQREQREFFSKAQGLLALQHEEAARNSLLAVHEASHVNLTRVVANLLWSSDFAPFVAQAQRLSIEPCRAMPAAAASASDPQRTCVAKLGRDIRALPGFKAMDIKAYAAMRGSTVFKIKVFDLRGITVYSSEHGQIGEDAASNLGWEAAVSGRPASEFTHRDRFSAFERVVENRDLISTYVPVRAVGRDQVEGVFELYSDVTPFLAQARQASQRFASITAGNDVAIDRKSRYNVSKVNANSDNFLLIVGCLLAVLYWVLLLIVGNGQRLIDKQNRAQIEAARREQHRHREKMAALATMAANVSHEVGNPLAIIAGIAQELPESEVGPGGEPSASRRILEQAHRVRSMMRRLSDFAAARSEQAECVDVNAMLESVCDFHAFDRRLRGRPIVFQPGAGLPACEVVPDHLKEVLMNLMQAWADVRLPPGPRPGLEVHTEATDQGVLIRIGFGAAAAQTPGFDGTLADDPRLESVRRRVADMRGQLSIAGAWVQIRLPAAVADPASAA